MRVYNFSAGPTMLPLEVLEQAQAELLDVNGSGMSVMELSHRGKVYEPIHNECIALFRELMNIPDSYSVLLLQGGASTQFEAVPLNLLSAGKADYVVTGNFANKAAKEAEKYGDIRVAASSKEAGYTYIPKVTAADFRDGIDYVHITSNNTIYGSRWANFPTVNAPLVCDMSSDILSREVDVDKFAVIYAGAQKNIAPAGLTVVIVRNDMMGHEMPICPTMLKWSTHAANNSLYNTPPCFAIYVAMLNLRYLKKFGGVKEMQKYNEAKAAKLYDFIDNSTFYSNPVAVEDRSIMNVPFFSPNDDLNAKFVKEAAAKGLMQLKGHRVAGGMRASIYNGMPVEGVDSLIAFMKQFEIENR